MTISNSTGKNKDFYELGKKMFDRLNPHIAHNPKVVGPVQEPMAWMVYTQDGQSVYVTDNPTDIQEGQRALPLYVTPLPQRQLESTTDMMMGLAERLGELPDDVDPRAWSHLLVYAPQRKLEQEQGRSEAFKEIAEKVKKMPWENDTKDSFIVWLQGQA